MSENLDKPIPIQTVTFQGKEFIVSQVRICRKCKKEMNMIDGNHKLYLDMENNLALHEHKDCNAPPTMIPYGKSVISPQDKQKFLYGRDGSPF